MKKRLALIIFGLFILSACSKTDPLIQKKNEEACIKSGGKFEIWSYAPNGVCNCGESGTYGDDSYELMDVYCH